MKYLYLQFILCLGVVLSASTSYATEPKFKPLHGLGEIAFLKSNDPNDQENAALEFFTRAYPDSRVLTPEDFMKIDNEKLNVTMIWIHADRSGLTKGWENLANYYTVEAVNDESADDMSTVSYGYDPDDDVDSFIYDKQHGMTAEEFIGKLKNMSKIRGVALYLSGHATQFVEGMDRIPESWGINIFNSNANNTLTEVDWAISGYVKDNEHETGHDGFASYGYIRDNWSVSVGYLNGIDKGRYQENDHDVYPMMSAGVKIDDNNCMWLHNVNDFGLATNCQVHGTWGHVKENEAVEALGLVEFLPDHAAVVPGAETFDWKGNMIANGLAACQWAPEGENKYKYNLEDFTFNTINYLASILIKEEPNPYHVHVDYTKIWNEDEVRVSYRIFTKDDYGNTVVIGPDNKSEETRTIYEKNSNLDENGMDLGPGMTFFATGDNFTYGWVELSSKKECGHWLNADDMHTHDIESFMGDGHTWFVCWDETNTPVNGMAREETSKIDDRRRSIHSKFGRAFVQFKVERTGTYSSADNPSSRSYSDLLFIPLAPETSAANSFFNLNNKDYYAVIDKSYGTYTGIEDIESETVQPSGTEMPDCYFNMQGIRISKPEQPGIYIHDGKKILVK